MHVRCAEEADLPELLRLMRELAEFEGYDDRFCLTEAVLLEHGFCEEAPDSSRWSRATLNRVAR